MACVSKPRTGAAAVLAAVCVWSFTNTLIKTSRLPALTFAVNRLWIGAVLLLCVLLVLRRRLDRQIVRSSAPGGAVLGIEILFFFSAVKHTSIADTAVIGALQPALVLLVAGPLFGERVTAREVLWTVMSLGGVVLVTLGSSGTPVWSLYGDILAAGSLLMWTAYFLVSKRARETVPALEYMTVVTITAAVVLTPIAALSGQPLVTSRLGELLRLVLFVVGATGGHVMLAWAHAHVDVSVSSLLMLGQPVVASLAALLVLGEPLTTLTIAGCAVVVTSLGAIVRRAARIGKKEELVPT
jgi:drug/metabolite transporter (DMT)-like permease